MFVTYCSGGGGIAPKSPIIKNPVMPVYNNMKNKPSKKPSDIYITSKNHKLLSFNYNNYSKPLNLSSVKWNYKPQGF